MDRLKALGRYLAGGDAALLDTALDPLRRWAAVAPGAAAEWVLAHLSGEARTRALDEIFGSWGQSAPNEALAWLNSHGPREAMTAAYEATLSGFAREDPAAAADWLRDHGSRGNLWETVFSAWGEKAPEEAARWVLANLPQHERDAQLAALLGNLQSADAARLLIANSPAASADAALQTSAQAAAHRDGAFAGELASMIQDPNLRQATQQAVIARWGRSDPTAAALYASQQGLAGPASVTGQP
jgi:hypothetical protein